MRFAGRESVVAATPVFAGVIGTVDAHFASGGDGGVQAARVAGRDGHVCLLHFGKALGQLAPGLAAVGGFEDAAVRAGVLVAEFPRAFAGFPQRGVEDIGIGRVHGDVGRAGVLVDVKHFPPVLAAVGGGEDAALLVRAIGMPQHGGEQAVRVARVHGQRGNLLAVAKAQVRPGLARVGGFVDAVADGEVRALQAFAAGHINDVGVGGSHRDGADGTGGLAVEDRRPGAAVVVGFPDAAVDLAHVEQVGLAGHAGGGARAAATEGTDVPPTQIAEDIGGELLGAGRAGQTGREEENTPYASRCHPYYYAMVFGRVRNRL